MINNVNRPPKLILLQASKQAENDPGSSQGSGMAYDGPPQKDQKKEAEPELKPQANTTSSAPSADESTPSLRVVTSVEQTGMTSVVMDLLEKRKQYDTSHSTPGLSTRLASMYSADSSPAKGVLLNRKAE